jgi:hypothetical protein
VISVTASKARVWMSVASVFPAASAARMKRALATLRGRSTRSQ